MATFFCLRGSCCREVQLYENKITATTLRLVTEFIENIDFCELHKIIKKDLCRNIYSSEFHVILYSQFWQGKRSILTQNSHVLE